MNFYWRQTIVGLLRHAAERVPPLAARCRTAARQLDLTLTTPWLEEAFSLFQDAALRDHDPVYVTGAFYTMRALEEVGRWEKRAGGSVHVMLARDGREYALPGGPDILPAVDRTAPLEPGQQPKPNAGQSDELQGEIASEAERGIVELFDRIRRGATLEEALALFPQLGDEASPHRNDYGESRTEGA